MAKRLGRLSAMLLVFALVAAACGGDDSEGATTAGQSGGGGAAGEILVDGSSTVFPVTQAAAERFGESNPNVRVSVGVSGTGGGFEKFCNGEIDISDASRPIKDEEAAACAEAGIEFIEMPVAYDGLSVIVNPSNDFVECLTTDQLNLIWGPDGEGSITNWNQVDPSYPDLEMALYGPDSDSGTFDYFTETINGEEGFTRRDYTPSADDNVLVQGVAGDEGAIGYFGYAYYVQNQDTLRLVPVDGGSGCVAPSNATIEDGTYTPLSRPLFIYVRVDALERSEVADFVRFYNENGKALAEDPNVGYTGMPPEQYEENLTAAGLD